MSPGLRHSETVPALFPAQTPSLFLENVIICAVLAVLSAVPIPRSHSESRTPRCGCADHHGYGSTQTQSTARVNRVSIVWLAVCRKGIARSAALHLDCARSARKRGTYRFTRSIFEWQHGWHSQCDGGKFRNFCAVKAKRRLPSNARRSLKLTQFGCDA